MTVAGKIYKTYNTPALLAQLTDNTLKSAGIDDKESRKFLLSAIRKAGYKSESNAAKTAASTSTIQTTPNSNTLDGAGSSNASIPSQAERPRKKRKRDDDLNEFLPDHPPDEGEAYGSLEFNEVLDEQVLRTKYTLVNRAPIMMAWACVVAERLGFQREEALSIASVYTEMNAITRGVSLGIFDKDRAKRGVDASPGGSQPYVDLMGRRPLYQTASQQWRALSAGAPVAPTTAFSYISRTLRQAMPHMLGALRLLAASYSPTEINEAGYSLYADFRPDAQEWGARGEVRCAAILGLRRVHVKDEREEAEGGVQPIVQIEQQDGKEARPDGVRNEATPLEGEEPVHKKPRSARPETDEYDAVLDADHTFDDLKFDLNDLP